MNRKDLLNRLELDENGILNYDIEAVPTIQFQTFVRYRKIQLPANAQPAEMQLMAETLFISRLEQSGPELTMDANCCPDDLLRQFFLNKHR